MKRSFGFTLAGLLTVTVAYAGGWAVITVEDLPDQVVAGERFDLTFTVRAHGRTPVPGLTPSVEAKAGDLESRAFATPGRAVGQYTATLDLRQPGTWTITIHSGYARSRITLDPITSVDTSDLTPGSVSDIARGKRLFVAKGCVSCHRHVRATAQTPLSIARELTGRRYQDQYLGELLANPAIINSRRTEMWKMPDLNLRQGEIAALVAFINDESAR